MPLSCCSGSSTSSWTLTGTLPTLSTAISDLARRLALMVRGTISAASSENGAISISPSSTTEPAVSSRDSTRTANGTRPARTFGDFGGAKVIVASASAPGNRLTSFGSAVAHAAASPTTSIKKLSTTWPVLRILIVRLVVSPGWTIGSPAAKNADAPTTAHRTALTAHCKAPPSKSGASTTTRPGGTLCGLWHRAGWGR